jgi:hypothetical protein
MTFDARSSAILEYLEAAIQALASARRLLLESVTTSDAPAEDDLPNLEPGE